MAQRESAKRFEDLIVWRKSHELVLAVYRLTKAFPREETYGLSSQLRRAAVSVPANIAEGFKKRSKADKARFLNISQGSLEETRYYMILAHDLQYGDTVAIKELVDEVGRLLDSYREKITASAVQNRRWSIILLSSVFCFLSSVFYFLTIS